MWSRKRIDIGWRDLLFAAKHSFGKGQRETAQKEAELAWSPEHDTLACLSVRSGFDLLWTELNLPAGSEVLMSAVTIRDMARVVEEHGLVPVPVDLDPSTMAPEPDAIRRAITPKTRAIVVAHLFGAILDLKVIAAITKEHGLLLIEDCAQAFDGHRYHGHTASDVVMFSFGPIKTATALAGGLLVVRDNELLARMRTTHASWPEQSQGEFLRRIRTYTMLKLISGRLAFGCLVAVCRLLRRDYDAMLNGAVRNFPVEGFFTSLRRQPCSGLLRLLARRIRTFDTKRQDSRADLGRLVEAAVSHRLPGQPAMAEEETGGLMFIPSAASARHTWWVLPICVPNAAPVIRALRAAGFDATCGSQLQAIRAPVDRSESSAAQADAVVRQMMFLPFYPEMPEEAAARMGRIVAEALAEGVPPRPVVPLAAVSADGG